MQSADEDSYDQTIGMPEQPGSRHFLSIGEVVDVAYKVLEFIGAGAFGEVYLVRHDILQRNFALKLLRSSGMDDAVRSRFVQEVQVMAKLEHPNIVKIYNSGVYKGDFPYYIMDLIVGKSLADLIAAGGRIDALSAVTIFTAVADALKVSHGRNIVHRDIKPANIIIADGDGPLDSRVRVVDFGVAKLLGRNSPGYQALTTVGQVFGSPLYMSPEQCNAANIDNRSDVYSLGCALYETLTGVVPFKGPTVMDTFQMHCSQAVPTLKQKAPSQEFAPELEEVIQQLMAKRPEDRFQNMTQVKNSLLLIEDRLKKRQDVTAGGAKGWRRRLVVGLLALLALGGLGAGALYVFGRTGEPRVADRPLLQTDKSENFRVYDDVVTTQNLMDSRPKAAIIAAETPEYSDVLTKPVVSNQFFKGYDKNGDSLYELPQADGNYIGKFSIISPEKLVTAPFSGPVTVYKKYKWIFRPDPIVGKNPSILLGFKPEDISGIDLDALEPGDRAKVLKAAAERFSNLISVVVLDHKVDRETLAVLAKMKSIQMLSINASDLRQDQFLILPCLKGIREFECANYTGDVNSLLELTISSGLKVLCLSNTKVGEHDLINLCRATNLERLTLQHVGMRREWLRHLLGLQHLAYLDLVNDGQNFNWVQPLKPFWRLKELVVRDDKMPGNERKQLHDMLKEALKVKGQQDNCNVRTNRNSEINSYSKREKESAELGDMMKE